jgi:hypothetical protein
MLEEAMTVASAIANPWLIASGLDLRARLLGDLSPGDPRVAADLAEASTIRRLHGLAAPTAVLDPTREASPA